eukprot:jgi/Chlat1/753/Chrsp104S01224
MCMAAGFLRKLALQAKDAVIAHSKKQAVTVEYLKHRATMGLTATNGLRVQRRTNVPGSMPDKQRASKYLYEMYLSNIILGEKLFIGLAKTAWADNLKSEDNHKHMMWMVVLDALVAL